MPLRVAATVCTALALVVTAIVHLSLASQFDLVQARLENGTVVTVGQFFRVGAGLCVVLAVLILVRPRRWSAALVAVSSVIALVVTVSTTIGPIELPAGFPVIPVGEWLPLRVIAAAAEAFALVGALTIACERPR
jgi:hypothetical protein